MNASRAGQSISCAVVDVELRLSLSPERGIDRKYLRQNRTRYYSG